MTRKLGVCLTGILLLVCLAGCGEIKMETASEDYIGKWASDTFAEFEELGFTDVQTVVHKDWTEDSAFDRGKVTQLTVNGSAFSAGDKFKKDAPVVIEYHTILQVAVPVNSDDIQDYSGEELASLFEDAGFTDVTVSEQTDLDPDEITGDFVNEVTIGISSSFDEGDEKDYDTEVSIITHYPYEKFMVTLEVDCLSNLLFSRYDVDIYMDDEKLGTLDHGGEASYSVSLKAGEHTFRATKSGSDSVDGEAVLDVQGNGCIRYTLSCTSDQVGIESEVSLIPPILTSDLNGETLSEVQTAYENVGFEKFELYYIKDLTKDEQGRNEEVEKIEIGGLEAPGETDYFFSDTEVAITYHTLNTINPPKGASSFVGSDYAEVITDLKEAGFTNIKTETKTTEDYEEADKTYSVTIDGESDFSSSSTFWPEDEVVVSYYKEKEYDKIEMPYSSSEYVTDTSIYSSNVTGAGTYLVSYFKDLGFTNVARVEEEPTEDNFREVIFEVQVTVKGETTTTWEAGDSFPENAEITIVSNESPLLTTENSEMLRTLVTSNDFTQDYCKSFASMYEGYLIEFDGNTAYVDYYKNYSTRFTYLIYAGDYSNTTTIGPPFKFEDVNYYDLNLSGDNVPDAFGAGLNIHIVAKIVDYNSDTGIIFLDPFMITMR